MLKAHFAHFLNYKCSKANVIFMVTFHCWSHEYLLKFANITSTYNIYNQFVDLRCHSLTNIASDYIKSTTTKLSIFMDFNCRNSRQVIEEMSKINYFNNHYQWILFDEYQNMTGLQSIFQHINLSVDTDLSYVTIVKNSNNFTIFKDYDIYNNGFQLGGNLNVTTNYEMACNQSLCLPAKYLSDLYKRSQYGNRNSLRDITMRVAVVVTRFDVNATPAKINRFLSAEKDFYLNPLARMGFQIFILLQQSLYTRVSLWYTDTWTDLDYTGGAIGALVNQQVDLTSAPFVSTSKCLEFLTPIAITGDFRSVCMFRTPRNVGINGVVFLEPFSSTVWLLFAIILVVGGFLLWLAFFVEFYKLKRDLDYVPSLLTMGLISLGSACTQGSHLIPSSIGGRFISIILLLLGFLLYNYYTSMIVSSLLNSPVKSSLKTMSDLADSDLTVGLEPLPYTFAYLNASKRPEIRRFVKRKVSTQKHGTGLWLTIHEGIMRMLNEPGFSFIFETSTGFKLIEQSFEPYEICDLNEIQFRPDTELLTHLHQNSSYKEIVRLKILRILESGIYSKHRRQWVRQKLNCFSSNHIINVGLEYTAPFFIMLLISYILVLLILLMELLWKRVVV